MSDKLIKVLLVEENAEEARSIREMLDEEGSAQFEVLHAGRLSEASKSLSNGSFDVVLLSVSLPDSSDLGAVAKVHNAAPDVPLVVLIDPADEEFALEAVRNGAQEHLIRGQGDANLLKRSIRYAIERKQADRALQQFHVELQQTKQYMESLIESFTDAIIAADCKGKVVRFNKGAEILLGYRRDEILGGDVVELYESEERAEELMSQMRRNGNSLAGFETMLRAKDGSLIPVSASSSILFDEDGCEVGTVSTNKDLRDSKEMDDKKEAKAPDDSSSRSYNLGHFTSKLEKEFQRAARYNTPLSLMLLEVDHFKSVKDTHGEKGGEACLKAVTGLVARTARQMDTVARYKGEELAIILPHTDCEGAMIVAERLREEVEAFDLSLGSRTIRLTVSIGVVPYTPGSAMNAKELLAAAECALDAAKRGGRNRVSLSQDHYAQGDVIVASPSMREVFELAGTLGRADRATVLITGETGTGKEIVARAIHRSSPRLDQPLVVVNCGAIPKDLMESELLGYAKGAFTGAVTGGKKGKVELAHQGTLFLDEIGELPAGAQTVLLRILDGHPFYPVGSNREVQVDVRVIASTNRDLRSAVSEGSFREDLFYRLNVAHVHLPPLRERAEDILPMAQSFLKEFNQEYGKAFESISQEGESRLLSYPWKGNVREMRNAIERVVLYEEDSEVRVEHLAFLEASRPDGNDSASCFALPSEGVDIENVFRELIVQALDRTQDNQSKAARLLGISLPTFRYRMEKYGLKS